MSNELMQLFFSRGQFRATALLLVALGCEPAKDQDNVAPQFALPRAWSIHEIERSADPAPFDLKVYVKIVFERPANEAALRDCLASAIEEFRPNDDSARGRQIYFTIRGSADEWRNPSKLPLADVSFDLQRGKSLGELSQGENLVLRPPN